MLDQTIEISVEKRLKISHELGTIVSVLKTVQTILDNDEALDDDFFSMIDITKQRFDEIKRILTP